MGFLTHCFYSDFFVSATLCRVNGLETIRFPESIPELLQALRRIEGRGAIETAKRARQTCGQIFRYTIVAGRSETDPAAHLVDAL